MAIRHYNVSDDLSLTIFNRGKSLDIHSNHSTAGGYTGITVTGAELPDLIARLIEAAEAMGISTVQGIARYSATAWKDAAKSWRHEALRLKGEMTSLECEVLTLNEQLDTVICERDMAQQALARAEEK